MHGVYEFTAGLYQLTPSYVCMWEWNYCGLTLNETIMTSLCDFAVRAMVLHAATKLSYSEKHRPLAVSIALIAETAVDCICS